MMILYTVIPSKSIFLSQTIILAIGRKLQWQTLSTTSPPPICTLRSFTSSPIPYIANPRSPPLTKSPYDEQIQHNVIKYVGINGAIEGPARLSDVLRMFDRNQFVLVEVDSRSNPPLCRIFSKQFLLDKAKSFKEAEKKVKHSPENVEKDIQFTYGVSDHDLGHKLKQAKMFLEKGYRLRILIMHKKGTPPVESNQKQILLERVKTELEDAGKFAGHEYENKKLVINFQSKGKSRNDKDENK